MQSKDAKHARSVGSKVHLQSQKGNGLRPTCIQAMMRSPWYHWHSTDILGHELVQKSQNQSGQNTRESPGTHGLTGINIRPGFSSAKPKPVLLLKPSRATQINQNIIRQKLCSLCYYQKYQFCSLRPLKNNYPWYNMHQSREVWACFLDLYLPVIQQQFCALEPIAFSSC